MEYLEQEQLIHGHLSSQCILVDLNLRIKIASPRGVSHHAQLRYSAPESIIMVNSFVNFFYYPLISKNSVNGTIFHKIEAFVQLQWLVDFCEWVWLVPLSSINGDKPVIKSQFEVITEHSLPSQSQNSLKCERDIWIPYFYNQSSGTTKNWI